MRCLLLGTCSGLTSFLTKKSGRRFVFCFGAWLRAGSLSGTYAGPASVPLPFRASFFWRGVANNRQVCSLLQPFEERLCGLKRLALRNGFAQSCSGRMAHSCPAYDTDRTPILEIWQIFQEFNKPASIMEAVSFCAGVWHPHGPRHRFPTGTGPGDSSRQESRTSAHFFVKKDLHPRKKTQAPEGNSSDACLLLQMINSPEPSVQSLGISAHSRGLWRFSASTHR